MFVSISASKSEICCQMIWTVSKLNELFCMFISEFICVKACHVYYVDTYYYNFFIDSLLIYSVITLY